MLGKGKLTSPSAKSIRIIFWSSLELLNPFKTIENHTRMQARI